MICFVRHIDLQTVLNNSIYETASNIPAFFHPNFITSAVIFWYAETSHPAWIGFKCDNLKSTSRSSKFWPFRIFLSISSAHQDWNAFLTDWLNVSFPERSNGCHSPVQDAGTNQTLISFSDSLFKKDSHWWALKTSNMHSACAFDLFSDKFSRIPSMYGTKILSTYYFIWPVIFRVRDVPLLGKRKFWMTFFCLALIDKLRWDHFTCYCAPKQNGDLYKEKTPRS